MGKKKEAISIGILGFGNMGQAIFNLLKKDLDSRREAKFYVCSLDINKINGAIFLENKDDLFEKCDIIFLCVKPQEFYGMKFPKFSFKNRPLLISIIAGVRIANIKKITDCQKIVRSMPNLPLQIGKGFIGWHANKKIFQKNELDLIEKLFSYFGKNIFVSSEGKLDAVTAISGSGPAYVFLFLDALMKSATGLGFSQSQAEEMVIETVLGSTEYFSKIREKTSLKELISKVKSKKGTTEAAFCVINKNKFYKLWETAAKKARDRSREISKYELK